MFYNEPLEEELWGNFKELYCGWLVTG